MIGKTSVRVIESDERATYKVGDKGYVDGFVCYGNFSPTAIVVIGDKFHGVPIEYLKII